MKICGRGHELTAENSYIAPGRNTGRCKQCMRINSLGRPKGTIRYQKTLKWLASTKNRESIRTSCPEYIAYNAMKQRCYNKKLKAYSNYGGRGIVVCERWLGKDGYSNFIIDVGQRPNSAYSIDRINNNGNYEPQNCRWATREQQSFNRRNSWQVLVGGEWLSTEKAATYMGLTYAALIQRLESHTMTFSYLIRRRGIDA